MLCLWYSLLALFAQMSLSSETGNMPGVAGHGFTKANTNGWEGRMKPKTRFSLAQENEIQTFNMRRSSRLKICCRPMPEKFHGATTVAEWATCRDREMRFRISTRGPSSMYNLLPRERGGLALKYHDSICWMLPPRIGICKAQGMKLDKHSYDSYD